MTLAFFTPLAMAFLALPFSMTTAKEASCTSADPSSCRDNEEGDEHIEMQLHRGVRKHSQVGEPEEHHAVYPYDLVKCPTTPPLKTEQMDGDTYDAIMNDFAEKFKGLPQQCEGMDCPVADVCGCILRMAGHDFMDYKEGVGGGSDACTNMAEADNAGLADCLVEGNEGATISEVYGKHCDKVSLADFVVLAAEAAMTYTREIYLNATSSDRGTFDFKSNFKYGRTTGVTCTDNQELPNPSKSCVDVERVFVNNLQLNWNLSAALMGVHTLGRASVTNSGFYGWWSDAKNSRRFYNNYFVSLYLKGWQPEQTETGKWQWGYSDANRDDDLEGHQMMLDSDMCLAWSEGSGEYKQVLAEDKPHSCAWSIPNLSHPFFDAMDKYNDGKFCNIVMEDYMRDLPGGHSQEDRKAQWASDGWYQEKHGKNAMVVFMEIRAACCNGCKNFGGRLGEKCQGYNEASGFPLIEKDTGEVTHPSGMAYEHVMIFANDEPAWMGAFLEAWGIATTNGFNDLTTLG